MFHGNVQSQLIILSAIADIHVRPWLIGRTQLFLPPTLNVAFRCFKPRIREPFPNEQLLRKKKIAATEQTIFLWETAVRFTIQKI